MDRREFMKVFSGVVATPLIPGELFPEDHYAFTSPYRETRREIIDNLKRAYNNKYDLSQLYIIDSEPDLIQGNLRTKTRSLVAFVERNLLRHGGHSDFDDFEDSLMILSVVRDEFSNKSFGNVMEGRIKEVVTLGVKHGRSIPEDYQKYIGAKIEPWESSHLNYRTIDDLKDNPDRHQFIPPNKDK